MVFSFPINLRGNVNSMEAIEHTTNHAQTVATTVPEIKYAAAIKSLEIMHDSSH
jgi:hypothetical protein